MLKASKRGIAERIDWATFGGLALAFGGILGGLVLEGGHIHDVAQITAAAIVLGGTLGAVLISKPWDTICSACSRLGEVLIAPDDPQVNEVSGHLIDLARQVRRLGIASLEDEAQKTREPFLRKALGIAADGIDSRELRHIMELEIDVEQKKFEADAAVFEAGGGYAPTIGIIGAVLGLIQVMKHLDHLEEVGRGIAVAFVATVYGVALANILLLPMAAKILERGRKSLELRELTLVGVMAVAAGTNPRMIQLQLEAYAANRRPEKRLTPKGAKSEKVAQNRMSLRRSKSHMAPSHDRWLVSYADFITLLFALFVVLFAASNADKEKVRQIRPGGRKCHRTFRRPAWVGLSTAKGRVGTRAQFHLCGAGAVFGTGS